MTARNSALAAVTRLLNGGTLEVRTSPAPATVGDPDAGALLAALTLNNPAFFGPADAVAVARPVASAPAALAPGVPGHYRIRVGGVVRAQGSASLSGGGGEVEVTPDGADGQVVLGRAVVLTRFTLAMPAGN
jgi:hypothetical protein